MNKLYLYKFLLFDRDLIKRALIFFLVHLIRQAGFIEGLPYSLIELVKISVNLSPKVFEFCLK